MRFTPCGACAHGPDYFCIFGGLAELGPGRRESLRYIWLPIFGICIVSVLDAVNNDGYCKHTLYVSDSVSLAIATYEILSSVMNPALAAVCHA